MKTYSFKFNALDKNGKTYEHVAVASLSFVRDIHDRFWEFLKKDDEEVFSTKSNALYATLLEIKKNQTNGTFIFQQEGSEWNFVITETEARAFEEDCELVSMSTPSKRMGFSPSGSQVGQYLQAIDEENHDYIEWFNRKFHG